MTQAVTIGQYNRVAYFYALDSTTALGRFSKDAAAAVMCRLDYSKLAIPPGAEVESYSIDVGSNPPLAISTSSYNQTGKYVDFILSGGIEGQEYNLSITITGTITRTDTMIVDVPLATCDCSTPTSGSPNVSQYPAGLGTVYINSAIKYTVSNTQPPAANLKDQWYSPSAGVLYEYITDGVTYWWQQIIPTLTTSVATYKLKPITPDGFTKNFTLMTTLNKSPNILASTDLIVSVANVVQNPDVDYRAFQDQIQFTVAPAANSLVFMTWFAHY